MKYKSIKCSFICLTIAATFVPIMLADECQSLPSGMQRCYNLIGVNLPDDNQVRSMLEVPINYIKSCGNNVDFLSCYRSVLSVCPEYRELNPVMFDYITMKAVVHGLCEYKTVYEDGIDCLLKKNDQFHKFVSRCITDMYFVLAVEAVKTGNWTAFCLNFEEQFDCLKVLLDAFKCGEDFTTLARHFLYSVLPRECRDGSEKFAWIHLYGTTNAASQHNLFYQNKLLLLIFIFVRSFLKTRTSIF